MDRALVFVSMLMNKRNMHGIDSYERLRDPSVVIQGHQQNSGDSAPIDTVLNVMPAIATEARPIKCGLLRLLIIIMNPCGRKFVVALFLPRNNYPILSNNVA